MGRPNPYSRRTNTNSGGQPDWDSTNMLSGWSNVPAGMLADRTRFLLDKILLKQED